MEKTMIASQTEMSDGQIENVCAKLRDALRKHRKEISLETAQMALGTENIGTCMFGPFRERAETFSEMIVRRVKVNRHRTPQQALDATGRKQYTDSAVVAQMPGQGEGEEGIDVYFLPLRKRTNVADAQKALEDHGLKPDAYAVSAVNEADPSFADSHPNMTQWVDSEGNHCYVAFNRWGDERRVICDRHGLAWGGGWWFGGPRK